MKKFMFMAVSAAAMLLNGAEVIFDGSIPENWQPGKVSAVNGVVTAKCSYSLTTSKDIIPVKAGKKYTVSGEFRITGEYQGKTPMLYFGVVPYTADGVEISHLSIATAMPHSIAALAVDAKAGDKSVTLKGAENWKFLPHGALAFNAKADRSDLPNMDLSPFFDSAAITKNADGTVTAAFKKPLAKTYPAGTAVRQHRSGNMFIYVKWDNKAGGWMNFSNTFKSFYTGTAGIKVALRLLTRNGTVEIRNVKVTAE